MEKSNNHSAEIIIGIALLILLASAVVSTFSVWWVGVPALVIVGLSSVLYIRKIKRDIKNGRL